MVRKISRCLYRGAAQVEKYMGPLMSYEQVKDVDERLTDFLFTKYIMTSYAEVYGTTTEKGLYTKPSSQVFVLFFFVFFLFTSAFA